jgi:homoserine O-acetyltransferase/O-succinyltransferase
MNFPQISVRDMVHVQKRLLDNLGVSRLVLVIGGSMGGMQALEWAVTYPDFMDGVAAVAAPAYSSAQAIAYNKVGREAVMLDPAWNQGEYYGGPGPARGMSVARSLGMITYQSELAMRNKFGRNIRNGNFEIENYLEYQGESLVKRFDANCYLYLLKALDLYDLGKGYASYEAALARIKARVLAVGVSSDILYPPYQQEELVEVMRQQGVRADYQSIESPYGHDGFLIDFHLLQPIIYRFLRSLLPQQSLPGTSPLFRAADLAYLGARLVTEI